MRFKTLFECFCRVETRVYKILACIPRFIDALFPLLRRNVAANPSRAKNKHA